MAHGGIIINQVIYGLVDYDETVPGRTMWLLSLSAVAAKVIMRTVAWKGFFWGPLVCSPKGNGKTRSLKFQPKSCSEAQGHYMIGMK